MGARRRSRRPWSCVGPTTAIDPRGPDRVYAASADLQTATCHVYRSTNGGASFTELNRPDFGQ